MKKAVIVLLGMGLLSSVAWGDSIVFSGPVTLSGFGFGSNPRDLTIQSHGPSETTEQGCIGPGPTAGVCAPADGLVGGDEAKPIGFPKQAAPTLSSLGITSGAQIGILFDGVQPQNSGNNVVTIDDLTLKLYDGSTLVYTVSGTFAPLGTNPGNGDSDYLFVLDAPAIAAFNTALGANYSDTISLDSEISFPNQSAGPDSYVLTDLETTTFIPEPSSLMLLGTGVLGLAGVVRRRFGR